MRFLDHDTLLDGSGRDVAKHLIAAAKRHGVADIHSDLLDAVELELLPPSVMSVWLSATRHDESGGGASITGAALLQTRSVYMRIFGIKNTGRLLRTTKWKDMWHALGGTDGWLRLFGTLSVHDVRRLSAQIGLSYKHRDEDKTKCVTELFYCLLSPYFPDAPFHNEDTRPLQRHCMELLPACSDECVARVLTDQVFSRHTKIARSLMHSHGHIVQKLLLESPSDIKPRIIRPDWLWRNLPSLKGAEPGITPAMSFALSILRLTRSPTKTPPAAFDMLALVNSLTSRAVQKHSPQLPEIVELSVSYYLSNSQLASNHFLLDVVRAWGGSRRQEPPPGSHQFDYTELLTKMIRLTRLDRDKPVPYDGALEAVDLEHRYSLLRLLVLGHEEIDIENDAQLGTWTCKQLSTAVIQLLGNKTGIAFIRRLIKVRPKGDFVSVSAGSFFVAPVYGAGHADHKLLLAILHQGDEEGNKLALTGVQERKKLALSSRDQSARSFYSQAALKYAVASRSLSLLADTLTWTKRYVKDPLTARDLYSTKTFRHPEVVALLSGLLPLGSEDLSRLNVDNIRTNIESANTVMEDVFETALEAKREPHYQESNWDFVKSLFRDVVKERTKRCLSLEESSTSPELICDAIWPASLDLIVRVERRGLQHGFRALWVNEHCRPHTHHQDSHCLKTSGIRMFYDHLAEARDHLWRQHRLVNHPTCADIPSPFPRGLPIQCLTLDGEVLYGVASKDMPFLAKRVEDIVFMDAVDAMAVPPPQDDIRHAIGGFVDAFDVALDLFVLQDSEKSEKIKRINRVHAHWTGALHKRGQISTEEVRKYVESFILKSKIIPHSLFYQREIKQELWPRRPTAMDAAQNPEWDPSTHVPQVPPNRKFPVVTLDCLTRTSEIWNHDPQDKLTLPPEWSTYWYPNELFSIRARPYGAWVSTGTVIEGIILARVLLLDSRRKAGTRQLVTSYPTQESVRYPAVYLDSQFLEKHAGRADRTPQLLLQALIARVPPKLLKMLIESYLDSLGSSLEPSDVAEVQAVAYSHLALLGRSDKPDIAHDLVIKTVLDRPEASSWHRQLLATLSSPMIPKATVETAISRYADEVILRLKDWSTQTALSSEEKQSPSIKITTIKQLPQMLQRTTSLPSTAAVGILRRIAESCDHHDVRVEVVNALLQILLLDDRQLPQSLLESVLSTLETFVSIVGSFNERRPLSEQQWTEYEASTTVPPPYAEGQTCPPLLGAFLLTRFPKRVEQELFRRILLPAMEKSKKENLRVMELIIRKHGQPLETVKSVIPFRPQILDAVIEKYHWLVPRSYFDDHCALVMENMQPSTPVYLFTSRLKADADLVNSDEARIWLSFYDLDMQVADGSSGLQELLRQDWRSSEHSQSEFSLELVQEGLLKQALRLAGSLKAISDYRWVSFIHRFKPPQLPRWQHQQASSHEIRQIRRVEENSTSRFHQHPDPDPEIKDRTILASHEIWTTNTRPVLETIIKHIDTLRANRDWGKMANGEIRILPSTMELKLWFLPVPVVPEEPKLSADLETYSRALLDFTVESITAGTYAFHEAMKQITSQADMMPPDRHTDVHCHVGIMAAEILEREGRSTPAGLFAEFAIHSIAEHVLGRDSRHKRNSKAYCRDEQARGLLKRMIHKWNASENESVWMCALKIEDDTEGLGSIQEEKLDKMLMDFSSWGVS